MKSAALFRPLLWFSLVAVAIAQPVATPVDTRAAARAAFTAARGLFSTDIHASVAGLRLAADLDPDYFDAHQYYILYSNVAVTRTGTDEEKKAASGKVGREVEALYQHWAEAQPKRATFQWALGVIYQYKDCDRALHHFEAASKLDPKSGQIYDSLALCAEVRGDLPLSLSYRRKAVEVEPENIAVWRHLIGELREANVDEGIALGLEMAKRFPDDAASIIGYLATRQRDEAKSRQIYELLREKFPKAAAPNLTGLFSIYLKTDAPKALALAQQMVPLVPDNKVWPVLMDYAQAVIGADALIAQGKAAATLGALGKIVLPRYGADRRMLDLTTARVLAATGEKQKAYDYLLTRVVKTPTDETLAALNGHGRALGKSPGAVTGEIAAQRAALSKPGVPFALMNYVTGKPVGLDDYKGRVVLVNFWYPMCGPCRGEFPFLQAVLEKYRDRGFEILAINGHAPEDHMVMPLLKGWKLDFLPLKSDGGAVDKNYKVRGYPANFLYGPDGKIYYEPPPVSTLSAQRELELQIEALLAQTKI